MIFRHRDTKARRLTSLVEISLCLCVSVVTTNLARAQGAKPSPTPTPGKTFVWRPNAAIPVSVTPDMRATPTPTPDKEEGPAETKSAAPTEPAPPVAKPAPEVSNAVIVSATDDEPPEFGPVVQAYLDYLRGEQEVVDARSSRHEISPAYYRRNTNRVSALRQMALKIARESSNDYLPELVAVARDEFHTIMENPPAWKTLRVGAVYQFTFRYLGAARGGAETFYVFARLDPYEQEELMKKRAAP